ncbi:MAG: immunity 17 family protein [Synergistaceae bacterium]|nr:immunity 17 family protein [Synergistaceae bacterium]
MEDAKTAVLIGSLFALTGVFSAFCAMKDYEWFMGSRKAAFLVKIFGRKAARMFYIVLGLLLVAAGCAILLTTAVKMW